MAKDLQFYLPGKFINDTRNNKGKPEHAVRSKHYFIFKKYFNKINSQTENFKVSEACPSLKHKQTI